MIVDRHDYYIVGPIVEASDDGLIHEWWTKVYPASVGQYTGLDDKNGTEIYERDVVVYSTIQNMRDVWEIKFCKSSFCIKRELYRVPIMNLAFKSEIEVISNIYENPELLEESR